ncbi:MAG: MBOAT family protein [Bacteroidetes bacterium]|nr:MBOAT family protein [Bacteroidota bacterium]
MFTQLYFWIFFAVVLIFYSAIYKNKALRNAYLFFISLFFYYKSGGYFFSLLIFSTIVDYFLGKLIYKSDKKLNKKIFLSLSIIVNLGVLSYFKYSYFFADVFNSVFDTDFYVVNLLAQWTNNITGSNFNIYKIILPVGISFYTFQTISYTFDVYRNKVKPVKNIIDFGFYVSFFPQLVAGPIVRAADFVPQLYKDYKLTKEQMGMAIFLILNGLIKKMFISDFISINFVDRVFDSPLSYSGFENLMAVYGYSAQIYCDFSGYTDIAIGVALLLGFHLPLNFNSPYKAVNIRDFWRRWHISLSSWLKDYLYIPLGGNRKGKIRTGINLLITMLIGGLWHGANWRFVIWGGIHGIAIIINKLWNKINPFKTKSNGLSRFISIFVTFHFVTFAWIFFRAKSMIVVKNIFSQMFNNFHFDLVPQMILSYKTIFAIMLFAFIVHWLPVKVKSFYKQAFIKLPVYLKVLVTVIIVIILYQVKSSQLQPFIYFQF